MDMLAMYHVNPFTTMDKPFYIANKPWDLCLAPNLSSLLLPLLRSYLHRFRLVLCYRADRKDNNAD
jgi:hypothetical protein